MKKVSMIAAFLLAVGAISGVATAQKTNAVVDAKKVQKDVKLTPKPDKSEVNNPPNSQCGGNKEIGTATYDRKTRCSKDPCPPNPMETCREWTSICQNKTGGGTYHAHSGMVDCVPVVETPPQETQGQ